MSCVAFSITPGHLAQRADTVKVLLLSAYAAHSHEYWRTGLEAMFPSWQWRVLSLPPRHFSWRLRGNPLYWSQAERETLEHAWDLLIATSMVDLATLRGLVPALAAVPTVLYFHENQFAYPQDGQRHSLLEAQIVSLYSSLAADRVVFNSEYNRNSFLQGCSALLRKLPDRVPAGINSVLERYSSVLPVPLQADVLRTGRSHWPGRSLAGTVQPLRLQWVGRFEHDKGGDALLVILQQLEQCEVDYELAVTGQQFRQSPAEFKEIHHAFQHRLVQFGYLESRAEYLAQLRAADIVLSTSRHEFQGLAVLEAVSCGCLPCLPARLVYPEIYPRQYCYQSTPQQLEMEAAAAVEMIVSQAAALRSGECESVDVSAFQAYFLAPQYEKLLRAVAASQDSH